VSARNRELLALIPASLLITAGFAAVFVQENDRLTNVSLTYGALFFGLCLAAHLVVRFTLPHADPYLFPLAATLACFGLVMIYRIDDTLAREQAQWFVAGLLLFAGTIVLVRDITILERSDDVGGVWRDNTYPGAACDVPSPLYSWSWAQNPGWRRRYSGQQEILHYLRRAADR